MTDPIPTNPTARLLTRARADLIFGTGHCDGGHDADGVRYIHARCHIGGRLSAYYNAADGGLRLVCGECEKPVAAFAVAPGDAQ